MKGETFVDIGAHIGSASIRAAWAGADRVIAYEPSSKSYYCLTENVVANLFENKITIFNKAVGPKGKATLIIDTCNTGASTCLPERNDFGGVDLEEVDMIPLSEVLEGIDNCYLKMDCEGGEVKIIPEIIDGLYKKIHTIVMEFHFKDSMFGQIGELLKYYDAKQLSEWEYKFIRK
jgi:FkbM family methyltransferase